MNGYSILRRVFALVSFSGVALVGSAVCYDLNTTSGTWAAGNDEGSFLYKFDAPNSEEGSTAAKNAFSTAISNNGMTATVSWLAGTLVDFTKIYLKGGPNHVWWDVSAVDWSLYTCFSVTNTSLLNNGGQVAQISHVRVDGSMTQVPDSSSTLALLGVGLAALGLVARRRTA